MRKPGLRVCVAKLWEGNWSLQRISIQLSCLLESNCGSWCVFGNCNSRNINPRELKYVKERDDKTADLEEQVRDFMLFIEAQKVLGTSSNGAELRDGSVLALPANLAPSNSSTRTVRLRKKKR